MAAGGRALLLLPVAVAACAKEEPPPGAVPERRPPVVREIEPSGDAVVPGFDGSLELRFDEPVRIDPSYEREILGSPALRYRVSTGFQSLRVRPAGGWREGAVYVLRLPPTYSDLLGNRSRDTLTVRFSTGPPITSTRVEGVMRDRATRRPVPDGRALFLSRTADTVPYTSITDREGRFALEALPPDLYVALGFRDLNGDLRLQERLEPHDSVRFRLEGPSDRAELALSLLPPDSTPPVAGAVERADSVTLRVLFDEVLDPGQDFEAATVSVTDTLGGQRREVRSVQGPEAPGDTLPLPSPEVRVLLERPLTPGVYRVEVRGLRNLRGLAGGGAPLLVVPEGTAVGHPPPDGARGEAGRRSHGEAGRRSHGR